MHRLLPIVFAGLGILLVAADRRKLPATVRAEHQFRRAALRGDWKVSSVRLKQPLKEGQTLPSKGDELKFQGTALRIANL